MRLKGKVAIVTGGTGGIGDAVVALLEKEGAAIAIIDRPDTRSDKHKIYPADLNSMDAAKSAVADVLKDHDRIDILANCAGIFRPTELDTTDETTWDEIVDLNLKAPFFLMQAVVPAMKRQGGGRIVNITSAASFIAFPSGAVYCATKGGLAMLTKALAVDLAPYNIAVNAVAPGNTKTPLNEPMRATEGCDERMAQMTPSGIGHMDPMCIAKAVLFLASDEADNIHGEELVVDGGVRLGITPGWFKGIG